MAQKLTDKEASFVREYLIDLNASKACIRAGYKTKYPHKVGSIVLNRPHVQLAIQEAMKAREKRTEVTQDWVIAQLVKIAGVDITDFVEFGQREVPVMTAFGSVKDKDGNVVKRLANYVDFKHSSEVDGTLIQEVKQGRDGASVKVMDRMKALELLGRHLGLFTDNVKLSGEVGVKIVDDIDE